VRKRRAKHTLGQVAKYFEDHGCTLLTKEYAGTRQDLKYRCGKCEHVSYINFNNFQRGIRCRHCYLKRISADENRKKIMLRQRLLTLTDMANILGVTHGDLYTHVKVKQTLPAPTATCGGKRKYYTESDIGKIRNMIDLMPID